MNVYFVKFMKNTNNRIKCGFIFFLLIISWIWNFMSFYLVENVSRSINWQWNDRDIWIFCCCVFLKGKYYWYDGMWQILRVEIVCTNGWLSFCVSRIAFNNHYLKIYGEIWKFLKFTMYKILNTDTVPLEEDILVSMI